MLLSNWLLLKINNLKYFFEDIWLGGGTFWTKIQATNVHFFLVKSVTDCLQCLYCFIILLLLLYTCTRNYLPEFVMIHNAIENR